MRRLRVLSLALALASCSGCGAAPRDGVSTGRGEGRPAGKESSASPPGAAGSEAGAVQARPAGPEPSGAAGGAEAARPSRRKAVRGQPLGVPEVAVLRPGEPVLQRVDLTRSLGRLPIVICYFRLGDPVGERVFIALQQLALGPVAEKVEVYGAVKPGPGLKLEGVADRLSSLGTVLPVIVDQEGFALGEGLDVTESPSIGLIDAKGLVRIADARSLKQVVSGTATLAEAIAWVAAGNPMPTIARLPRYYPVVELIGEPFPDFTLPRFGAEGSVTMSDQRARNKGKVIGVLFWHPACEHCLKVMPSILAGRRAAARSFDLISIVDVKGEDDARDTGDAIGAQGIDFPVLQDDRRRVHSLCNVITTPTLVFVRPDGIVDSVYYSGEVNYLTVIQARVKAVLGLGGGRGASTAPGGSAAP